MSERTVSSGTTTTVNPSAANTGNIKYILLPPSYFRPSLIRPLREFGACETAERTNL